MDRQPSPPPLPRVLDESAPWPSNANLRQKLVDRHGDTWVTFAGDIPEEGATGVILGTYRNGVLVREP